MHWQRGIYMKEIALKESDIAKLKKYPLDGIWSTESEILYYKKDIVLNIHYLGEFLQLKGNRKGFLSLIQMNLIKIDLKILQEILPKNEPSNSKIINFFIYLFIYNKN